METGVSRGDSNEIEISSLREKSLEYPSLEAAETFFDGDRANPKSRRKVTSTLDVWPFPT